MTDFSIGDLVRYKMFRAMKPVKVTNIYNDRHGNQLLVVEGRPTFMALPQATQFELAPTKEV